jgi:uncharacterized Zn finger protein (UPF0148 family)
MATDTMVRPRSRISKEIIEEYRQIEMAIYEYQLTGAEVTALTCPRCGGKLHFR